MHLSITLANDQLDAKIFLIHFITVLYMHMFRAISCSSSGGQIVLIQHLVTFTVSKWPSAGPSGAQVHRTVTYWEWRTRCCINTIWPPEDEQDIARNMCM